MTSNSGAGDTPAVPPPPAADASWRTLAAVLLALAALIGDAPAAAGDPSAAAVAMAAGNVLAEPARATQAGAGAATVVASPPPAGAGRGQAETTVMALIRLLVAQGVLTPEKADQLIRQAEAEAAAGATQGAASGVGLGGAGLGGAVVGGGAAGAAAGAAAGGETVRVPYIPEPVRKQIREEVKQEVMIQAQAENWAAPNQYPDWVERFSFEGDIRLRYEHDGFANNNAPLVNFNAINTGPPFDTSPSNTQNPPLLNTDEDRNRFLLRGRLGTTAVVDDDVRATFRIASGNDSGPVSTNQTLGSAPTNGQGSNFSKYNLWLDRAFLRFTPLDNLIIDAGRAPNPFFATELIWDEDLNFDGLSARYSFKAADGIEPFFTLGGFPVYNTDFNFSTYDVDKESSHDRYMMGVQGGVGGKPSNNIQYKIGLAYYHFFNMNGELSSPCLLLVQSDQCDSDITRQQYQQKGNTYFALRDIIPNEANNFGAVNQWQYFGLASQFHELAVTGRLDLTHYDPIHVVLDGEFVANLGYDRDTIRRRNPVNNLDDDDDFDGGNLGFLSRVTVGHPIMEKLWDWNVSLAYRYLESDAVVDGLTDSDFNLGGTNAKGFVLAGNLGVAKNTWLRARWLSSDEVSGPPVGIDIFQLDLNARF